MNAIGAYVDALKAGSFSSRQKSEVLAARMDVGLGPQDGLSARGKEIDKARGWFMGFTHIDQLPKHLPDEDVVRGHFGILEKILDEHLNAFFPQRNAISALLAAVNQRDPETSPGTVVGEPDE